MSSTSPEPGQKAMKFLNAVRVALDDEIRAIEAEARAGGTAWTNLQHRRLAERIKALVVCWRMEPDWQPVAPEQMLDYAAQVATELRRAQGAGGLFTGGDNVDSPPDSAFSVNDLADALHLLRTAPQEPAVPLVGMLEELLAAAAPALARGGIHTPNHRWEISAALARLHRLEPRPELVERVQQWLAEGLDIDADGLYSERSANYAAYVSNPSLLAIAEILDLPELVDLVERNLDATLDLILPDGSVETVMSRRQDQRERFDLAPYLLPLRKLALLRDRGDLAWAANLALEQGIRLPGEAATRLVLDPSMARILPSPVPPVRPRQRLFTGAGLLLHHQPTMAAVVFGGSDYASQQRIRSGLANCPTLLRMFAGEAVLDSVRLSRTFFGLGPFRSAGLAVDNLPARVVTLAETVSAGYHQPLAPANRDPGGEYRLGDEGRFSAAMSFDLRAHDEITLNTQVQVGLATDQVELLIEMDGAVVDWALELAFRPGGTMTGAWRFADHRWQLDLDEAAAARYQFGDDAITVTVAQATDGQGDVPVPAYSVPVYEPGEEYRFLGGTDAVAGELLYITGRVPARVRIMITACTLGDLRVSPRIPNP